MKIAVTTSGTTLDDRVDPRFGRCPYYLIVDTDTMHVQAIENPNQALGGGAGIQAAQSMASLDVHAVLTGNCGPNAYRTLQAAGIDVVVGIGGTIREAVALFKSGRVATTGSPNVVSHFGMGRGMGMGGGGAFGPGLGGGFRPSPGHVSPPGAVRPRLIAVVDADLCTGCGTCGDICSVEAITVRDTAVVTVTRCIGCGQCVDACTTGALSLRG